APTSTSILVDVEQVGPDGPTVVMAYAPKELHSFMRSTAVLDELGLTIVDARIVPMTETQNLDTYRVRESDGSPLAGQRRLAEIRQRLQKILSSPEAPPLKVSRRAPRQVRMFSTPVQVAIAQDPINERTVVELVAGDRPGLLLQVARVFEQEDVALQNAKIATIGERAEDVFFVTGADGRPLDDERSKQLEGRLKEALS